MVKLKINQSYNNKLKKKKTCENYNPYMYILLPEISKNIKNTLIN